MSLYRVILRAKSCAHFPEGHSAQARHIVQPSGETVEVLMLSEYIGTHPGDLIAVVTGPGSNPEDAVSRLASFGISLMDMLSVFTCVFRRCRSTVPAHAGPRFRVMAVQ